MKIHLATPLFALFLACAPARGPAPSVADDDLAYRFSGKTVLFYDPSHGNQVEYYDPIGRCYLWYPTNNVALAGEWRTEGPNICFRYGDNTYNPVTGDHGGSWDCSSIEQQASTVVDAVPGDAFGLSSEDIPFRLPAHPRFRSVSAVRAAP